MARTIESKSLIASRLIRGRWISTCLRVLPVALAFNLYSTTHSASIRDFGPDLMLQQWAVEDGIPGSQALCVAQSTDGYIWLGTYYGIARFDGLRFTSFDATTPGIPHGGCFQILPGPDGSLYCRFRKKLVIYEDGAFDTIEFQETVGTPMRLLHATAEGTVYLASKANTPNSIHLIEADRNRILQRIEIPSNLRVTPMTLEMCRDDQQQFWLRLGKRLGTVANGQWQIKMSLTGEDRNLRGPVASREGGVWIARDRLVQRWQDGTWVSPEIQVPSEANNINRLIESPNGDLWVLAPVGNVFVYRRMTGNTKFSLRHQMKTPAKTGTLVDHEGNHWFSAGTSVFPQLSGLFRIHERVFRHTSEIDGLPEAARGFAQNVPERMTIAANSGVYEVPGDLLATPTNAQPEIRRLIASRHWTIASVNTNAVVAARYQVSRKERASGETMITLLPEASSPAMPNDVSLSENTPRGATAIVVDRDGAIWAADRFRNLLRIHQGQTTYFDQEQAPLGFKAYSLACDNDNNLWIGTFENGLVRYNEGHFHEFSKGHDHLNYSIRALTIDQEGTLWLGTSGHGLVRFLDGEFREFNTTHGLPTNELNTIVDDHEGHLWFGSYNGIHRVSKAQLARLPVDSPELLSVRSFGIAEGLSTLQCNSGHPASIRASDGRLWFGTINGINIVDPSDIKTTTTTPKMILENIYLDGVPHSLQNSHTERFRNGRFIFTSRVERIEFHYTAISFGAPDQVRFRYRLPPFINDWQEAGFNRQVVVPQLKPGQYEFQVTAANPDGLWSEEPKTVPIEVLGRWWERTAAQILMAITGLGFIFGVFALRTAQLRRRQAAREQFTRDLLDHQEADRKRIAQELHDSLEQNLLVIKNRASFPQTEATADTREQQALREISDISGESIEEVRAIANNLRPYQIDRLGLSKAIQAMLNQIDRSTALTVQHEIEPVPPNLSAELQINLYRIIQEALNNVLKHAQAEQVTVTLIVSEHHLSLRIKDNGVGFEPKPAHQQQRQGFGINGIFERVAIVGGTCELNSAPGNGTTWSIRLDKASRE